MFDSLRDGLKGAFKSIGGKGSLTEGNMRDAMKLVEQSLLDADVSFDVVKKFMASVTEKSLGQKVLLSLNPGEEVVRIVNEELIDLLGPVGEGLDLNQDVNIIMMCGLQGAGKTTTCGKLAKFFQRNKIQPMMVAADLQRPAAIEQLHTLGRQLEIPVYSEEGQKDPVAVCRNAVKKAREENRRVVILDTAGRLAIDEELMNQLKVIDREVQPHHVFLVVDGMTGQDAVNSAAAFHDALELNGVIMTKLDGDARGGALLSVKSVTGVPIRFIGTGEHLDDLDYFRPEGMASRILGMGDIVAMAEEAHKIVSEDEQRKMQESLEKGQFDLNDFRAQMEKMAKPGLMQKMMGLLPGMGDLKKATAMLGSGDTSKEIKRMVGIIDSMTSEERKKPEVLTSQRRQRIATGAGVQSKQVNDLIKQYDMMKPMLTGMATGSMGDRRQMMQDLQEKMMDPSKSGPKTKKSTGKRLTAKQRAKMKKEREKLLRQKKRRK